VNGTGEGSPRKSYLDSALRRQGAVLAPFEGFLLAERFHEPADEYY